MSELKRRAVSGMRWNAVSMIVTVTVQITQATAMAHLLAPESFGLVGMVLVVSEFAQMLGDLGVSAAIIHRQDATREQLSSLYWLTVLMGLALALGMLALSPLIAWVYHERRLLPLMPFIAAIFLVAPFGQQFRILLQRDLQFRRIAAIDMVTIVSGTCTATGLAFAGVGPAALLAGPLAGTCVRTSLLALTGWRRWRPAWRLRREDVRGFVSFGLFQMGERTLNLLILRMDQLLLGRMLGAQALGYYNFSYNLLAQPTARLSGVLTDVAFPLFARLQDDPGELRRGYLRILNTIMLLLSPLLIGVTVVAPQLVPTLFGQKWLPAVPLMQLLAVVALLRAHANPVGSLLLARGRADLSFRWVAAVMLVQTPVVLLGVRLGGAAGVCLALIGMQVTLSFFNYAVLVRTLLGPCLRAYLRALFPPAALAAVMAGVVAGLDALVHLTGIPALALLIGAGAVTYVGLAQVAMPAEVARLRAAITGKV